MVTFASAATAKTTERIRHTSANGFTECDAVDTLLSISQSFDKTKSKISDGDKNVDSTKNDLHFQRRPLLHPRLRFKDSSYSAPPTPCESPKHCSESESKEVSTSFSIYHVISTGT